MTNNKGITLIALVITIIVLLILAGVSIAMLTGQNGILNQATQAKDDTAKAEVAERVNMAIQAAYTKYLVAANGTASTTMPVSKVVDQYNEEYGTNSARAGTESNTIKVTLNSKEYTVTLKTVGQSYTTTKDSVK